MQNLKRIDLLSPPVILAATVTLNVVIPFLYSMFLPFQRKALLIPLTPESIVAALAMTVLWVSAWAVGYAATNYRLGCVGRETADRRFQPADMMLWAAAIIVLSPVIYALVMTHPAYGGYRSGLTAGLQGKVLFIATGVASVLLIGLSAALAASWRDIRDNATRAVLVGLLAIATAACLWALWSMGGRGRALAPLIGMVAVFHYYVRPLRIVEALAIAVVGLVALTLMGRGNMPGLFALLFDGRRNFDGFYSLTYIYNFFGGNIASWGEPSFNAIASDLGLRLGPSTPDIIMSKLYADHDGTWSIGLSRAGEILISFGWLGIAVFGVLCGSASAVAYRYLVGAKALGAMSVPVYFYLVWSVGIASFQGELFESLLVRAFPAVAGAAIWLAILRHRASIPATA